jgi:hypothetical protein
VISIEQITPSSVQLGSIIDPGHVCPILLFVGGLSQLSFWGAQAHKSYRHQIPWIYLNIPEFHSEHSLGTNSDTCQPLTL